MNSFNKNPINESIQEAVDLILDIAKVNNTTIYASMKELEVNSTNDMSNIKQILLTINRNNTIDEILNHE